MPPQVIEFGEEKSLTEALIELNGTEKTEYPLYYWVDVEALERLMENTSAIVEMNIWGEDVIVTSGVVGKLV